MSSTTFIERSASYTARFSDSIKGFTLIANRSTLAHLCLVAQYVLLSLCAVAEEPTFTSFDPPGSRYTIPLSINNFGSITGYYFERSGGTHGFLRAPDGNFTRIDVPGATATGGLSINDAGWVTGYFLASQVFHGFLRMPDGQFVIFDPPGSTDTMPQSINSTGMVTGGYIDANGFHGFLRAPDGTVISFDPLGSTSTAPSSINSAGEITGFYADSARLYHGFVRAPDGTFTIFDAQPGQNTEPASINSAGEVTGTYGPDNNPGGFLRTADGVITTFAPKWLADADVVPFSINDAGVITGFYDNYFANVGIPHGFIRRPDGAFVAFNITKATRHVHKHPVEFIFPFSINSAGEITGYYQANVWTTPHGFLRSP